MRLHEQAGGSCKIYLGTVRIKKFEVTTLNLLFKILCLVKLRERWEEMASKFRLRKVVLNQAKLMLLKYGSDHLYYS